MSSGYTYCLCCGDDTVSSDTSNPELCELCVDAGCDLPESDEEADCQRPDEFERNNDGELG